MDERKTEIEAFRQAVGAIRATFPYLNLIEIVDGHQYLNAAAEIPRQAGLDFDVSINLQNRDELHLNAGELWVEWFPCRYPEILAQFIEAVTGLLAGEYRIVETYVLGSAVAAQLQRPSERGGWEPVTGRVNVGCLVPLPRKRHILQNTSGLRYAG